MKPAFRILAAFLLLIGSASFFASCHREGPEPVPVPEITGLNPRYALPGEEVTITGHNFPANSGMVTVKLGNLTASIVRTTTETIVFTVPELPEEVHTSKVEVIIEGKSYFPPTELIIDIDPQAVYFESFSPGSGQAGTVVTIIGENFDNDKSKNIVKFNGVAATVLEATTTQLKVTVPAGVTAGKITVTVNNKTQTSDTDFIIATPAVISVFTPDKGSKGTLVSVTGSNFKSSAQVFVNGVQVPAGDVTITPTTIQLKVPAGATEGKISIKQDNTEFFSTANFKVTDAWRLISSTLFPHDIYFGVSFTDGSKIYVGLGSDQPGNGNLSSDFFSYDPVQKNWVKVVGLSSGTVPKRTYGAATFYNGKVYVGTGINELGGTLSDWYEYDFGAQAWSAKSNPGGSFGNVAFTIGSKSYLALGSKMQLYEYDHTTATWSTLASAFPIVYSGYAFVIDNTGYFGGGVNDNNALQTAFYELKQTQTGAVVNSSASLPAGAGYFAGFAVNGKGYITYQNQKLYEYNPTTNTWLSKAAPPEALLYAQTVGGRAYAVTGTGKVYEYVPE